MTSHAEAQVCIANIGPKQRRLRMVSGIASFSIAVIAFVLLEHFGASRWARLGLLLPLWSAAIGVLQAREKT